MLNINEKINGFTLLRVRDLEEISATLYEFEHDECGARLAYLDRDDTNKTFAIAFPTPPEDDTGVFHIIEHSVLCGSKKYPMKDPFAELLKGSLNTFLNAMTYEDRTVYPVSSRCEKDFLNLVDVYLDAVLSPAMLDNPSIFKQEGWHFEYDKESDTLSVNGVVYNEMKGAYSSPDEIGAMELSRAMYPDTYLGRDSGGDPRAIPDLTYEKFIETYKKHYAPSGAKIILDGKMELRKVLELIDSHLTGYSRSTDYPSFSKSAPKTVPPKRITFEIPEGEDTTGHARFLFGYSASDYSDKRTYLTATVISDLLTATNASPLKKALLDRGLAKDATMYITKSVQNTLVLEVRDTDEEKLSEIEETIEEVISKLSKEGIDKNRLIAILDNLDFKQREQDFGSLPVGIAYALSAFGHWMYGSAPEDALLTDGVLSELRRLIDCDYFERSLSALISDNPHKATVIMVPDKALARKNAEEELRRIASVKAEMSDSDIKRAEQEYEALCAWQASDDEELTDTLPKLSLSDIADDSEKIKTEEYKISEAKVLRQSINTNGIVYISMHFCVNDIKKDEILPLSILSSVLTNLRTKSRDVLTLQSEIKSTFGTFYSSGTVLSKSGEAQTHLKFFASALESKKENALELILDVLLNTEFDDECEIENVLLQAKSQLEDSIISSGESVAISRAEAGVCQASVVSEYLSGYEAYKVLRLASSDENCKKALINKVKELYTRLIKRQRLTLSFAGEYDDALVKRLVNAIPAETESPIPEVISSCTSKEEFFVVPSKVAYAALSGKSTVSAQHLAYLRVARSILSYEYLWNTIRVKNGAYGAGFVPRRDGVITFYSYRDPSPAASLKIFRESADYLRAMADSDCDLTKFIIGAIGEYDPLTTPRTKALLSMRDYLLEIPPDFEDEVRRNMLKMTREDLLYCAEIIDCALENARVATVGGAEHLKAFSGSEISVIEI